jgi:hypothetical protein
MKSIKILFVTLFLLDLGLVYAQFNTFSMDKKGNVKSISQNNYYPLDLNEPKKGFYAWNEGENLVQPEDKIVSIVLKHSKSQISLINSMRTK